MSYRACLLGSMVLVLVPACSLPRGVEGTSDAGPGVDAFSDGLDAGPRPDTGIDAWAPEIDAYVPPGVDAYVPPVDAYVPPGVDAYVPPVDAYVPPPDAYVAPDAWSQPSCDATFGVAAGYLPCGETPSTCEFYVMLGGVSCDDLCGAYGQTCTAAFPNGGPATRCTPGALDTCSSTHSDELCTCTRP